MTDTFPGQHSTTTRVTTTQVQTDLRYDPTYFRTFPGLVKCVQLVCLFNINYKEIDVLNIKFIFKACNILGFFCMIFARYSHLSRGSFFKSLAGIGFWFTGILLLFYIFHVIEKFFRIPWLKIVRLLFVISPKFIKI